jgi:hypothetical protein
MSNKFFKKFAQDAESIKRIANLKRTAHPVWDLHSADGDVSAVRKTNDDFDLVKSDGASIENTYKNNLVPEQVGQYMVVYFAGKEVTAKFVSCDGINYTLDHNGTNIIVPKYLAKSAAACPTCGIDPSTVQPQRSHAPQKPLPPDPRFGPGQVWDPDLPEQNLQYVKQGPIPDAEPTPAVDYQSLITAPHRQ